MQIIMQNLRKGNKFFFHKLPLVFDSLYICTNFTLIQLKEDLNLPRRQSSEFPDFGEGYKDTQSNKGRIQGYTV